MVAVGLAVVRGQELAAVRDLVANGGDVVLPAPRAEKVERLGAVFVPAEDALDVAAQGVLGTKRLGKIEGAGHAQALGDRPVELVDALDADRVEHLLPDARHRVRDVGVDGSVAHVSDLLAVG